MGLDGCVFVVQVADAQTRLQVEARIVELARFYAPLGAPVVRSRYLPATRVVLGEIDFGGQNQDEVGDLLVWGGPLPAVMASPRALLEASDQGLRALESVVAAVAVGSERLRVVGGCGGLATLHTAVGGGVVAWATHAVAAAWLATGAAHIEPVAVAELLACEFVGDSRSLVAGVRVLPTATCVDIDANRLRERSYWPLNDRWAPIPAELAYEHAEAALRDGLAWRARSDATFIGLTAGLDSRVVAASLKLRSVPFRAFTWGEPGWDDVSGAASVASELGVEWSVERADWEDDEAALARVDAEVRWTEAAIPTSFARSTYPDPLTAFVTGGGGEIGRCFYYRDRAHTYREPDERILARGMPFAARLAGAHHHAVAHVRERVQEWLAEASQTGHRGWARLDVLYGEQRVRRWGRGMLSRRPRHFIPAFATPEVGRALASMPTAEKAVDGFHRRFLERHVPALALPAGSAFREPGVVRSRLRHAAAPVLRPAVAALRGWRAPEPPRWWAAERWDEHLGFRDFLCEEVLTSALLTEAVGDEWMRNTRARLLAHDRQGTELALLAAAPVALQRALVA